MGICNSICIRGEQQEQEHLKLESTELIEKLGQENAMHDVLLEKLTSIDISIDNSHNNVRIFSRNRQYSQAASNIQMIKRFKQQRKHIYQMIQVSQQNESLVALMALQNLQVKSGHNMLGELRKKGLVKKADLLAEQISEKRGEFADINDIFEGMLQGGDTDVGETEDDRQMIEAYMAEHKDHDDEKSSDVVLHTVRSVYDRSVETESSGLMTMANIRAGVEINEEVMRQV
jgi:hypothetical protein